MDKNKLSAYLFWLMILIILILESINLLNISKIPEVLENDKDYRYGWMCSEYKFKSPEDTDKGWNCLLEQCEIVSENPRTEECVCVLNNLTVNRVCTRELYLREYPYPVYNKPQRINLTQEEYNQIISGEKNLSDAIWNSKEK